MGRPGEEPVTDGARGDTDFSNGASRPVRLLAESIATGALAGLAPIAPATAGAAVAGVAYWFMPFEGNSAGLFALIAGVLVIGTWAAHTVSSPADPDPRRVVVDEFVGMWATVAFLDKTWPWMLAAFFTFRVLDIAKPWPVNRLERLPGGLGIMADDLAAGIIGAGILNAVRLAFFV